MSMKQLLQKNKKQFVAYTIGAFLTILNGLSIIVAFSVVFGIIEETTTAGIIKRILIACIFVFLPVFIQFISRYLRIGFMRDILIQLRTLAYEKIMAMSYVDYKSNSTENYMSHLVSDINLFEQDFFLSLLNIIYCFGTFIVGSIILLIINPIIALSTVFVSVILFLVTIYFEPAIRKAKADTQKANADVNVEISNILNGMEVIKLYSVEEQFKNPFKQIVVRLETIKNTAFRKDAYHENINNIISTSYQMLVFVYATYLYTQNVLSLSALIVVFSLMGQMVGTLISGFAFINKYKTSVTIFETITSKEDLVSGNKEMIFKDAVAVKDLSYTYDHQNYVLDKVNLHIKKGDKVLITGPSGVGKTTLLNCLSQNIVDYQGLITVDGIDLKDINHESFLKHCGYIRQEHFLFNDSIKNNIILNSDYDDLKLKKILNDLDLLEWIECLDEKEDYILKQDGSNVSGGQRQRISIARELYQDKEVLFIDEPSASLDDYTSEKVYETLFKLNKTIVCVSHRHLDYLKDQVDHVIDFSHEVTV